MTITITAAWIQRGWSQRDNIIDDHCMSPLVGREYPSLRAAMRAAERLSARQDGFATIEYTCDGESWRVGCEPSLPGRPALRRRL